MHGESSVSLWSNHVRLALTMHSREGQSNRTHGLSKCMGLWFRLSLVRRSSFIGLICPSPYLHVCSTCSAIITTLHACMPSCLLLTQSIYTIYRPACVYLKLRSIFVPSCIYGWICMFACVWYIHDRLGSNLLDCKDRHACSKLIVYSEYANKYKYI